VDVCEVLPEGDLDIRRKAQIAFAGAMDHAGEVVLLPNSNFDIDRTIFGSLDGRLPRAVVSSRVGITPFWSETATVRINRAFAAVPAAPRFDQGLMDFMNNDCNFAMEHADGRTTCVSATNTALRTTRRNLQECCSCIQSWELEPTTSPWRQIKSQSSKLF
jgi:hypothetical protein